MAETFIELYDKVRKDYLSVLKEGDTVSLPDREGLVEYGNCNSDMKDFIKRNRQARISTVLDVGREYHLKGSSWYWFSPWLQLPSENYPSFTERSEETKSEDFPFGISIEAFAKASVELAKEVGDVKNAEEFVAWVSGERDSRGRIRSIKILENNGVLVTFRYTGQKCLITDFVLGRN